MRWFPALVLALAAGAAPLAAPPSPALAQAPDEAPVVGKLDRVTGNTITLSDTEKGTQTRTMSEDCARDVDTQMNTLRVLKLGQWVKATIENGLVVRVERSEPRVIKVDPEKEAKKKKVADIAVKLVKGDRIRVNGTEATFVSFTGQQVIYEAGGRTTPVALGEINDLEKLQSMEEAVTSPSTGPTAKGGVTFGQWLRVETADGKEWYGYVVNKGDDFFELELYPDGTRKKLYLSDVKKTTLAEQPKATATVDGAGAEKTDERAQVSVPSPEPILDWNENVYSLKASVTHSIEGMLLVGARVEARFLGPGNLVPPRTEALVLEAEKGSLRDADKTFDYNGVRHLYRREPGGTGVIVAELSPGRTEQSVTVIGEALFPGLSQEIRFQTKVLDPKLVDAPRVVLDEKKHLLPIADERAIPHIVRSYGPTSPEATRIAALRAMPENGSPKLLPFLLLELYDLDGPEAERVKRAFVLFGSKAEKYLIPLVSEGSWKKEFEVPSPQGGVDKVPARSNPDKVLVQVFELLQLLAMDTANQHVLPHVNSGSDLIRTAALRYFTERRAATLQWLIRRLATQTGADARLVLKHLESLHPGTLAGYMGGLKEQDLKFEDQLVGLSGAEIAEKRLDWITEYRKKVSASGQDEDEGANARQLLAEIDSSELQATKLRRELSEAYLRAARSGPEAQDRSARMRLLTRAVTLDPKGQDARQALAQAYVEVAKEIGERAHLREGPGVEHKPRRPVKKDEILTVEPLPEGIAGVAEWHYVKASDGVVGWVSASVVQKGKTQLIVERERHSPDDVRRYLLLARALVPESAAEVDVALAEAAAAQAVQAAAAGDLRASYERYLAAQALAPGRYTGSLALAYLRLKPLVAVLAVLSLMGFAAARRGGRRPVAREGANGGALTGAIPASEAPRAPEARAKDKVPKDKVKS